MKRRPWLIFLFPLLLLLTGGAIFIWPGFFGFGYSGSGTVAVQSDDEQPRSATDVADQADDKPGGRGSHSNDDNAGGTPDAGPHDKGNAEREEGATVEVSGDEPPVATDEGPEAEEKTEDPGRQPTGRIGGAHRRIEHFTLRADVSPDGSLALTAGQDDLIVWSPDKGEPVWRKPCMRNFHAPGEFSPSGEHVVMVNADGHVEVLTASDGESVWVHECDVEPTALRFHPDGDKLFVGFEDGAILDLNAITGDTLRRLATISDAVEELFWEPAASLLYVFAEEAGLLTVDTAGVVKQCPGEAPNSRFLVFASDGRSLVHGEQDGMIIKRSLPAGGMLARVKTRGDEDHKATPARAGPDRVLSRTRHGIGVSLQLWDTVGMKKLHGVDAGFITAIGASPDGRHVVTAEFRGEVQFWKIEGDRIMPVGERAPRAIYAEWFPDGRTVLVGEVNGRVSIRDAVTMKESDSFETGEKTVPSMRLSPTGDKLVVVDSARKPWLWDLATRERVSLGDRVVAESVQFSNDGTRLYLAVDEKIGEFDTADGTRLGDIYPTWRVGRFRVNPDANRMALGGGQPFMVDVPSTTEPEQVIDTTKEVHCLRFSDDGRVLAIGSNSGLWLWDVGSKSVTKHIEVEAFLVAFRPLHDEVLIQDVWGKIYRYALDGTEIETLGGAGEICWHVSWSPDGRRVLAVGDDSSVYFWDVD